MRFSLIFKNSNDLIPLQTVNSLAANVLCEYVEELNKNQQNEFLIPNHRIKEITDTIHNLKSLLNDCNSYIFELADRYLPICSDDIEYLDQRLLNKLHSDFVQIANSQYNILEKQRTYNDSIQSLEISRLFFNSTSTVSMHDVLIKLNKIEDFNSINYAVHTLESRFDHINCKCNTSNGQLLNFKNLSNVQNIQGIVTNDIVNFSLPPWLLGRNLYNKFMSFDHSLEFDDENTYNELPGVVDIHLAPPQQIPFSAEYINWCATHQRIPTGDTLPIGNIVDLTENLTTYRKIIYQNALQQNSFSIQLNKGN